MSKLLLSVLLSLAFDIYERLDLLNSNFQKLESSFMATKDELIQLVTKIEATVQENSAKLVESAEVISAEAAEVKLIVSQLQAIINQPDINRELIENLVARLSQISDALNNQGELIKSNTEKVINISNTTENTEVVPE